MGYFSYWGRAGRLEFMVITAMNWVICALVSETLEYLGWTGEQDVVLILLPFAVLGFLEAPVLVRRLRDMGRRLKSAFLLLLPIVNIVFLFLLATKAGSTEVELGKKPDYESMTASGTPLKCPDCASTNCVRDNALYRVGSVLGKVMRKLPPVWYQCFDCGHEWKE